MQSRKIHSIPPTTLQVFMTAQSLFLLDFHFHIICMNPTPTVIREHRYVTTFTFDPLCHPYFHHLLLLLPSSREYVHINPISFPLCYNLLLLTSSSSLFPNQLTLHVYIYQNDLCHPRLFSTCDSPIVNNGKVQTEKLTKHTIPVQPKANPQQILNDSNTDYIFTVLLL